MSQLIDINQKEDIPENYNNTPIGLLLEYQNLKKPFENVSTAQLLIGMCMDNRKHIPLPDNYAFIFAMAEQICNTVSLKSPMQLQLAELNTLQL